MVCFRLFVSRFLQLTGSFSLLSCLRRDSTLVVLHRQVEDPEADEETQGDLDDGVEAKEGGHDHSACEVGDGEHQVGI